MMTYCIRGTVTHVEKWTDKTGKPGHLLEIRDGNGTARITTTNAPPQPGDEIEAIGAIRQETKGQYVNTYLTRATINLIHKAARTRGDVAPV